MADVGLAITYAMSFEDSTLSGKVTVDDGGRTRFGIAERFHPELTNCLFYTTMGSIAALQIAKSIYDISYCQPLCIAQITDQAIANKLLSLGINIGVVPASKMLQSAVGAAEDGVIGALTLMKLSSADPAEVLADLKAAAEAHYYQVAANHPEDAEYLNGWLARAKA